MLRLAYPHPSATAQQPAKEQVKVIGKTSDKQNKFKNTEEDNDI